MKKKLYLLAAISCFSFMLLTGCNTTNNANNNVGTNVENDADDAADDAEDAIESIVPTTDTDTAE